MTEPFADTVIDTATLLPNGRVLITGGYASKSDSYVRHTELYDPSTGTFARSADTIGVHGGQPATLLMNGKVLIAGGATATDSINCCSASAEVYDPATGTWAPTGNLTTDRGSSAATLLPDGSVLVAGGLGIFTSGNFIFADQISSAEIYDPTTGAFSAVGAMIRGHYLFTATLLSNGKVLITGGSGERGCGCPAISLAELYNPPVLVPAPVLFSVSGDGRGQGAIWHAETGQIASSQNPAAAGEVLSMYTSSLGDGSVIPPQVAVGGRVGEIVFFGNAPGYPGFNQINFRVPSGVAAGTAIGVRLTYLGRPSNEVTIGIQCWSAAGGYVPVVLQLGDASTTPGAVWIAVSGN